MQDYIKKVLQDELGFNVNEKALNKIDACDDWYCGEQTDWHKRTNINGIEYDVPTINFAKRLCADDANLCEVIEVNASENEAQFEGIKTLLDANRFNVMYRKQLEQMSAGGTVGCYMYLDNAKADNDGRITSGDVRINYCDAMDIVPLTVVNEEIIECAFTGSNLVKGIKEDVLVTFTMDENGNYVASSYYFVDGHEQTDRRTTLQLGDVKPFAIMRTAEVNNLKDMEGYGLPKLWNVIPFLKAIDLGFHVLYGDLDKGDKIVFINELLSCVRQGINGQPELTPKQKEIFVLLGEKLPQQDDVIKEYNPIIRIDDLTKVFELILSFLSMLFGYGTKKYTFENGQIKSATEYIGEKQDAMQELNKQRQEAVAYIRDIVSALVWFSNSFSQTAWADDDINVEFDDSYVTNKEVELERKRNDAITFQIPELLAWYLQDAYNLTEDEALRMAGAEAKKKDENLKDDANIGEDE